MAKSSKRSHRRRRSHCSKKSHRRRRTYGGLSGAPLSYQLSNEWPSKMSMGQGGDYLKYHVGQHGGVLAGTPLQAVSEPLIPLSARGAAHLGGIDKALSDVSGLRDQAGGRRRRAHSKKSKKSKKSHRASKKSKKSNRRSRRRRGGAHEYAPYPSHGMLLSSPSDYAKAGLSRWEGVETDAARARADL